MKAPLLVGRARDLERGDGHARDAGIADCHLAAGVAVGRRERADLGARAVGDGHDLVGDRHRADARDVARGFLRRDGDVDRAARTVDHFQIGAFVAVVRHEVAAAGSRDEAGGEACEGDAVDGQDGHGSNAPVRLQGSGATIKRR